MNKFWIAVLGCALASSALAQTSSLYAAGRAIADEKITVKPWGSGTIAETDETSYQGTSSIRVFTRNLFQGGIINFGSDPNLATDFQNKNDLLRLTFRLADDQMTFGPGASSGGKSGGAAMGGMTGPGGGAPKGGPPGGFGPGGVGGPGGSGSNRGPGGAGTFGGPRGGGGSQKGGGMGAPGMGGMGAPGMGGPGGMSGPGGSSTDPKPLKTIRLVITTTDGKKSEAYLDADVPAVERGWKDISIPLQAINGFDKTNKIVQSVSISGDESSTLYIGDLRVINDTTPISGEPNVRTLNLAVGDEFTFTANGLGGSSALKYSWNFDDKNGSSEPDAVGQVVKRKFRKPGDYTVTLTISDQYGLKAPYKTTLTVKVNP